MRHSSLGPLSAHAQSITSNTIYQHYKGDLYRVLAVARHSETLEEVVVYQALYGEYDIWVRPVSNWLETVTINDKITPRFTQRDASHNVKV
jgi:hypothetical protein